MDEETNSETTRPAGREDVVRAHAAEKEWLALYFVKHDRTPEVSIVTPLLFDVRCFSTYPKSRYIYLLFVSTASGRFGDEILFVGVCVRFVCFSSRDGEDPDGEFTHSECAKPATRRLIYTELAYGILSQGGLQRLRRIDCFISFSISLCALVVLSSPDGEVTG